VIREDDGDEVPTMSISPLDADTSNDVFLYRDGDGIAQILDFAAGPGIGDRIAFGDAPSLPGSFGDVLAVADQSGTDTVLDFGGGDSLTLLGVNIDSLNADDFIF
jgi:hypothetical protein